MKQTVNTETIVLKILVVGEPSVGKTSLVQRFTSGYFSTQYKSTIGVDFATKLIPWKNDLHICIQFWDLAGQDRLNNQIKIYYREAAGALCVCDVTDPETAKKVLLWKDMVKANSTNRSGAYVEPPCVLVVNKIDLVEDSNQPMSNNIDEQKKDEAPNTQDFLSRNYQYQDLAKGEGFLDGFGTSAKTNVGISSAVHTLIEAIMADRETKEEDDQRNEIFKLGSDNGDLYTASPAHQSWRGQCGGYC